MAVAMAFALLRALVLLPGCPQRAAAGRICAADACSPPPASRSRWTKPPLAYQGASGQTVRVSFAASSALARQIEQGAPADVFLSADLDWMDYLQQRKLDRRRHARNLLGNALVLVAPADAQRRPVKLRRGVDLLPRWATAALRWR